MSLYLTSTEPEVLATVERNREGRKEFIRRALAWAEERGADSFFPSGFAGTLAVRGLPIKPEGFGRWTKGDHRGCHWPYANNEPERTVMKALTFQQETVPGLPGALHSVTDADGRSYLMYPTPFVHDGAAWVSYSHQPESGEVEKIGPQWSECLASAYHIAHEAVAS